jgi:hypothetical protein
MTAQNRISSRYINKNFRIKVSGIHKGTKLHTLIGVAKLIEILGAELSGTIVNKATNKGLDKVEFKFRRGIKIILYAK